jgi:hypothetical protein
MPNREVDDVPPPSSISCLLFPGLTAETYADMEVHRTRWERKHGPTDLTRYYTSRWPAAEADQLCEINPKEYFLGLPPFVQDYLREKSRSLQSWANERNDFPARVINTIRRLALGSDFDPPRTR